MPPVGLCPKTGAGATVCFVAPAIEEAAALSTAADARASAPLSREESHAVSAVPAAFPARRSKARRDGPGFTRHRAEVQFRTHGRTGMFFPTHG